MTSRRLRTWCILIALTIWTVLSIDFATPGPLDRLGKIKGTDFLHFYVLGSIVHEGRWNELYDIRALYARSSALAPTSNETLYLAVESPQTALLFAPLARLSYTNALTAWFVAVVLLYIACAWTMARESEPLREHAPGFAAASAAFPGFFSAVINGQLSVVALGCIVGAIAALRRGCRFAAGFALGMLVFKPHWACAAGAIFLIAREWRVIAGASVGALVQTAAPLALVPGSVFKAYGQALGSAPGLAVLLEPRPGDSLKGFYEVLIGRTPLAVGLYVVSACIAAVVAARVWRSRAPFEVRASAVVLGTLLISPHANSYDLILLAPVLALMTSWMLSAGMDQVPGALPWLLSALFVGPLLTNVPSIVRMQFTVTAMAALLAWCGVGSSLPDAVGGDTAPDPVMR